MTAPKGAVMLHVSNIRGNTVYKLTWEQAKQAMRDGKRVRNKWFSGDEFFEMKDGKIVCEMGYNMAKWYRGESWQDCWGWSVIE